MVGQEHITKTLKNQIISGRVGHAYLFNGGRGTGKTTAAKILARAVNCLNPKDGEPCNKCEICKSMLSGSLTDVVEMDAASNNSVDDIRAIRDEVNFLPTLAKYRVYIIDEVHMLSTGAFNALLKTLEEPPEHVKFILATTEPQKLPATILSRCQRFDFKQISVEDIVKRLEIICRESKITITNEALKMIAVLSEGALRDAISILERCSQDEVEEITEDQIRDLVGIPKLIYVRNLVTAIINNDYDSAIKEINTIINEGKDLDNFLWEIIKYIKDILVYKTTRNIELYSNDELEHIKKIGNNVDKEKLLQLIYDLSELANQMKWSTQKNIVFEAGIIRACMIEDIESKNLNEIKSNNKIVETKVADSKINNDKEKTKKNEKQEIIEQKKEQKKEQKDIEQNSATQADGKNISYWGTVLDKIKGQGKITVYTNLIGTNAIKLDDMTVGIKFPNKVTDFMNKILSQNENKSLIEKLVSLEEGNTMRIKYLDSNTLNTDIPKDNNIENLANKLDIPINIIDD